MENSTVKTKSSSLDGSSLTLNARLTLAVVQAVAAVPVVDPEVAAAQPVAVVLAVDLEVAAVPAVGPEVAAVPAVAQAVAVPVPVVPLTMVGQHGFISSSKILSGIDLILMSTLSCSNQEAMSATQVAILQLRSSLTTVRISDSNRKPRNNLKNLTLDSTWDLPLLWEF